MRLIKICSTKSEYQRIYNSACAIVFYLHLATDIVNMCTYNYLSYVIYWFT